MISGETYDSKIKSIVDTLVRPYILSDYERYKVLHDWLAAYLVYDYAALKDDSLLEKCNDPEYCLETATAVCGGYASLYKDLCDELGLYCEFITGEADFLDTKWTGHAWNAVKLNGNIYHLDVCWDDTNDAKGTLVYDWFMQGSSYVTNSFRRWDQNIDFSDDSYTGILRSTLKPYNVGTEYATE